MFFVVILMIISFGTILHLENYSYKKWLPKLVLMAVLINFSKTICGLLIDISQVAMLTFVNAFKDIGGGNAITMLGITDVVRLSAKDAESHFGNVSGAYFLGIIYLLVAIVVFGTMAMMLVMRLVMIWIYVILSPLAYLMSAFPGGQKYASQWWDEFIKNLIVGPVLAFFIWLSLATLQHGSNLGGDTTTTFETVGSTAEALLNFVVAIGMLIGGLTTAQSIGGAAGGIAGKGMGKLQKGAAFATGAVSGFALARAKSVGQTAGRVATNTAVGVGSGAVLSVGKVVSWAGKKSSIRGLETAGGAIEAVGGIGLKFRQDRVDKIKKEKQDKRQKFLKNMGMGEKTMEAAGEFLKTDAGKNTANVVGTMGTGAAIGAYIGGAGGAMIGGGAGLLVSGAQALAGKYGKKADQHGDKLLKDDSSNLKGLALKVHAFKGRAFKFLGKTLNSVQSFATETTQKAASQGGKEITDAKKRVEVLAEDPTAMDGEDGFNAASFYNKSGQTSSQKKLFEQLTSPKNPYADTAIKNLINWVKKASGKKEKNKIKALAEGIAAFHKGGGDISSLGKLIGAVDARNGGGAGTVASLDKKVIANRKTGQVGEQGSGDFHVNSFANNAENVEGKNVVGVDFSKLEGTGLDTKAEASFVSGDALPSIARALSEYIAGEKADLLALKQSGQISDTDFVQKNADLDKAQTRLANPENLKNLNLVNTASANYGRQERMTSVYHEEVHAGGVEDEDLTENIAKSLMNNKLYGRNPATKGRHATEVAQMAKGMKDGGMSNDDVMVAVDKEIKARVQFEGKSRAERVTKLESGAKETVSQAMDEHQHPQVTEAKPEAAEDKDAPAEQPTIDLEAFQAALDGLGKKIEKSVGDIKLTPTNAGKNANSNADLAYLLKTLRKSMSANTATVNKIGNQPPTTVIEASAINDVLNS
jgi:hypothetical protein